MLLKIVFELNMNGIFHLNVKPKSVLYHKQKKELKLCYFGYSYFHETEKNPVIKYRIQNLLTPQQIAKEDYYGRDLDLWGIAQTIYFCLQGSYAFRNYTEDKKLNFKVKVSEECENLLTRMLAHDVKDRLTPKEILNHPWLNECETYKTNNGSSFAIDDNIQVNSSFGKFHLQIQNTFNRIRIL